MTYVANFDVMKDILGNNRITLAMIKPYTKIQPSTFASTKFLLETSHDVYRLDGLPVVTSDADLMKTYGISPGENMDVDPRIALAILVNKGNPEAMRIINAALRQVLLQPAAPSSDRENALTSDKNESKNSSVGAEEKNELPLGNLFPPVGIPTGKNELPWDNSKIRAAKFFPVGSKITKPIADVRDYLEVAIKNNLSDPNNQSMISVNELVAASGVKIHLPHWSENNSSKAYVDAVMRSTGKSRDEIFRSVMGKGTWVHVLIAIEIARWIDPDFSVMVNDIVLRVMSGDLSLIPQIADQHDKINNSATNIISVAAGSADQIRQTTVTTNSWDAMTENEAARQAKINEQQAAFNHDILRPLNFELDMTKQMLYEKDEISGRLIIAKEPDGRSPKIAVECMLKALKPDAFKPGYITTLYDCIELMWFMIANYENSIAIIADQNEQSFGADMTQDAQDKIFELERTIKSLSGQIANIKNASRLAPLINGLIKARGPNREHIPDLDVNAIYNLIDSILDNDRVDPSVIMATNWHLTYGLGQDLKSHRDFRNLVAVINDVADILRADIESEEYKAAIPKSFGDIFAEPDKRAIDAQAPSYWRALNLPEVNGFTCATVDLWSMDLDQDKKSEAGELNPESAYSMLTPIVATKKRAAPTRTAIAKKAEQMPDELRAALLKNIEDRANSMSMCFMNSIDEYTLHLYIGQLGWAGNIVPKRYTAAPSLVLLVSMREILDVGAWHFRPAGQITLIHPMTTGKAIAKLSTAIDRERNPIVQPVNQGAVSMTKAYISTNGPPWVVTKNMIIAIADALGKTNVSTILHPDDEFGTRWNLIIAATRM